ncbi:MAG: aminoacyl-tRNA deacylase, partial [Actinomycetota bacterium]
KKIGSATTDLYQSLVTIGTAMPEISTRATEAVAGTNLKHEVVVTQPATSAEESAGFQGVPIGRLLKSLVVRRGDDDFVFVLVPGDRQIDWKKLRGHLGVSRLSLPDRDEAKRATGYDPGTITPFGSTKPWPVVLDESAATPGVVTLGAGERGVNIHVDALDLKEYLNADIADVTKPP